MAERHPGALDAVCLAETLTLAETLGRYRRRVRTSCRSGCSRLTLCRQLARLSVRLISKPSGLLPLQTAGLRVLPHLGQTSTCSSPQTFGQCLQTTVGPSRLRWSVEEWYRLANEAWFSLKPSCTHGGGCQSIGPATSRQQDRVELWQAVGWSPCRVQGDRLAMR